MCRRLQAGCPERQDDIQRHVRRLPFRGENRGAHNGAQSSRPALKDSKITWNKKTLDKFLLNPMAKVPGTAMPMLIADNKIRADVVAYLATLKK
jgi:cytochrome c2